MLPDILSRYVRTGKLKVEARVLDFIAPIRAAAATR